MGAVLQIVVDHLVDRSRCPDRAAYQSTDGSRGRRRDGRCQRAFDVGGGQGIGNGRRSDRAGDRTEGSRQATAESADNTLRCNPQRAVRTPVVFQGLGAFPELGLFGGIGFLDG